MLLRAKSSALSTAIKSLVDGISPEEGPTLWTPNPGPQTDAFYSEADELFYGGAAGGGKSDLLLGLGLQAHSRAVIFRREYPQLSDLIDRSMEIVGASGKLKRGSPGRLTVPGHVIQFGSCPHEQNKFRWQGRPHDLKGFDEVCHFSRSIFMYLKTWARTSLPDQRVRVVACGNPPTSSEGAWVIEYWAPWLDKQHENPALPGELRWFVTTKDGKADQEVDGPEPIEFEGEVVHPRSRTFIPALLSDNPFLASDDEYLAVIQSLPEPYRSQMLYGDFSAMVGDDEWQVIPSEWYDAAVTRWESGLFKPGPMTAVGVDVARGGGDNTTLAPLHGEWFDEIKLIPGKETPEGVDVARAVVLAVGSTEQAVVIGIDVIGVGSSPYDVLRDMELPVEGINFGAGTNITDLTGKLMMANIRAGAYWKFREALDPRYSRVAIPPDPELRTEMLAARWSIKGKRILIEDKQGIKARIGRSPDKADSVVLAWWVRERSGPVAW